MPRQGRPAGAIRWLVFLAVWLLAAACGGGSVAPSAVPLGQEVVVDHSDLVGASGTPKTSLGITVKAVRTGAMAELGEAFDLDADQKSKTPLYVDVHYANKGSNPIDRNRLDVSLEDQDGNLINSVVIFNYGGEPYGPCTDNGEGELAPGESFDTCTLFLVDPARTVARVSFLPYEQGKDTDFIYWNVK
jgi:hypothetical protein